jgi:hypothetical protein
MRLLKKSQNALFVEEEIYNWKAPQSNTHKRLFYLSLVFIAIALLFSALN